MVAQKPAWIHQSHFKKVSASKGDQLMNKWTIVPSKDSLKLKIVKYNW